MRRAVLYNPALIQQNRSVTQTSDSRQVVRHEDHRTSLSPHILHFAQTLALETCIAHGQNFVRQQNLRLHVRSDRERQTHIHSAGVAFDRSVNKLLDLRKRHDLVEFPFDLRFFHSKNSAVKINVFPSR